MDEATKEAYAEVFEVLKYMDRNIVMKIPLDIIELFSQNKNDNYKSKIDYNDIFNKNNISKKALNILAWLNINYFSSIEEKQNLIKIYRENDYKEEQKKKEIYNSENIFKYKENIVKNSKKNTITEETSIVEYKEKNFLQKIFDKIKYLFKKN